MAAWNALLVRLAPTTDVAMKITAIRLPIVPTVHVDGHVELPSSIPEARPANAGSTFAGLIHLDPVGVMT